MKLAIHKEEDKPDSWNLRWSRLCKEKNIDFINVDCYSPDLIEILRREEITHLMWSFSLFLAKDAIVAKSILNSVEQMGICVFPNFSNRWHFEDKLAQKYILEAIGAPVVQSWGFYKLDSADKFLKTTNYPIVAKLRKGAGSKNVVLLKNYHSAKKYTSTMFNKGVIPSQGATSLLTDKTKTILKKGSKTNLNVVDLWKKFMVHMKRRKHFTKEIGYVYFQEFLPNNKSDLRIAVVGNRAWGFYRGVRKNDFRASGSGIIDYETPVSIEALKTSFEVTEKLGTQSLCFDYVLAPDDKYRIVEICYGYVSEAIYKCAGYWDKDLNFHEGHFFPEECILEDFYK